MGLEAARGTKMTVQRRWDALLSSNRIVDVVSCLVHGTYDAWLRSSYDAASGHGVQRSHGGNVDGPMRDGGSSSSFAVRPHLRVLVFVSSTTKADTVARQLNSRHGVKALAVHYKSTSTPMSSSGASVRNVGGTRRLRAQDALDQLKRGHVQVIVAVDMLTEGFDVPELSCVVLARRTDSEITFIQQVGRGLRVLRPANQPKGRAGGPRPSQATDKTVTVVDMAFNLRRRWMRFSDQQIVPQTLHRMVASFWRVQPMWVPVNEV